MTLRDVGLLIFISKTVTLNNMTVVGKLLLLPSALVSALLVKIIRILLYKQHRPLLKKLTSFLVNTLSFIHQPDKVAQRTSDVSAVDWRYQTQKKGIVILDVYSYVFSLGWKSLKKYSLNHNLYLFILFLFNRNYPCQAVVCLKTPWDF